MNNALPLHLQLALDRQDFSLRVNVTLPANGITVLFGPSGSGKTTLLRCVAGLEKASGRLALGDDVWQDSQQTLFKPTWQRDLGYVFQEASLFEHMDVQHNLMYGVKRAGKTDASQHLQDALELLGIAHLRQRTVASLSGGERQRVAIARALATRPQLLLLDEPLASLDVARRKGVLPWLEGLRHELRIPMLYVTHSVDELARLADHVLMLEQGQVASSGPVTEVMASQAVALAIGEEAGLVTTGAVMACDTHDHMAHIQFGGGSLWVRDQGLRVGQAVRVRILARDVSLSLSLHNDITIQNRLQGVIEAIGDDAHPAQAMVRVRCGTETLLVRVTQRALRQLDLHVGSAVWCQVKSVALMV